MNWSSLISRAVLRSGVLRRERPPISKRTRWRIAISQGFCCRYCSETVWPWSKPAPELDHIIPFCEGGGNWRNLAWSCRECNRKKGTKRWNPRPLTWTNHVLSIFLMIVLWDWPRLEDL